jgi:hypothetical protein
VLLDDIVSEWSRRGVPAVNDVLTHYIFKRFVSIFQVQYHYADPSDGAGAV